MIRAKISYPEITLTLVMPREELKMLYEGLGKTCVNGRMKDNMSKEEADLWNKFYEALEEAGV